VPVLYLCAVNLNQLEKIKVGIVNYLNTRPLLYGIEQAPVIRSIELIRDYPAHIASFLLEGSIDLGLVPVAILPRLKEYHIVTDYCIGSDGPVASVCLFSDVPIEEVKEVLLDYQSRTSVALAKLLLRDYWKVSPKLSDTHADYRSRIKGNTAGLVIGDRSFEQRKVSPFIYDLGEAWKNFTGLPFVFAAWVCNKKLDEKFIEDFNAANREGVRNISKILQGNDYPLFDLNKYYNSYISYNLDDRKRKGLQKFLELKEGIVEKQSL